MDEQSPTQVVFNIDPRSPFERARDLIDRGGELIEKFEANPRDPRMVNLAAAHFSCAVAIASVETGEALKKIADAVARRAED